MTVVFKVGINSRKSNTPSRLTEEIFANSTAGIALLNNFTSMSRLIALIFLILIIGCRGDDVDTNTFSGVILHVDDAEPVSNLNVNLLLGKGPGDLENTNFNFRTNSLGRFNFEILLFDNLLAYKYDSDDPYFIEYSNPNVIASLVEKNNYDTLFAYDAAFIKVNYPASETERKIDLHMTAFVPLVNNGGLFGGFGKITIIEKEMELQEVEFSELFKFYASSETVTAKWKYSEDIDFTENTVNLLSRDTTQFNITP